MDAWQDEYVKEVMAWNYKSQIRRGRRQTSLSMKMMLMQQIAARGEHNRLADMLLDMTSRRAMNDEPEECRWMMK